MSEKQDYEKVVIKPTGLRGISSVANVRLDVMLEDLISDIVASVECNALSAQFIADEITNSLANRLYLNEDIKAYVEAIRAKGNP